MTRHIFRDPTLQNPVPRPISNNITTRPSQLQRFLDVNTGEGQPGGLAAERQGKFDKLFSSIASGLEGAFGGTVGGGSGVDDKKFSLRSLALQREELLRQRGAGLRDIEQARTEGLRSAINNALQRGIFRSGIRETNEARVVRESGEAAGDLRERIRIALEQLKNSEARVNAVGEGGSGGSGRSGGGFDPNTFARLLGDIDQFGIQDPIVFEPPFIPPRTSGVVPPTLVRGGGPQ